MTICTKFVLRQNILNEDQYILNWFELIFPLRLSPKICVDHVIRF